MISEQLQEDQRDEIAVVEDLLRAVRDDGFTAYCCGPKDNPRALILTFEWPDHLDVVTIPRQGPAAAARLAKPADVLNPPDTAVWACLGGPEQAIWALLGLRHPDHPDAPAEPVPTPAALRVPRELQRPTSIKSPPDGTAAARAARLSQPGPSRTMSEQFFNDLLDAVDSESAVGFALNFAEDGEFTWGNFKTLTGRTAITEFTQSFFSMVTSVKHQLDNYWQFEASAMTTGSVTFTRLDGSVTVRFAALSHFTPDGALMTAYQVYLDPSPLVGVTVPE